MEKVSQVELQGLRKFWLLFIGLYSVLWVLWDLPDSEDNYTNPTVLLKIWMFSSTYLANKTEVFTSEQLCTLCKYSDDLSTVIFSALRDMKMHVHSPWRCHLWEIVVLLQLWMLLSHMSKQHLFLKVQREGHGKMTKLQRTTLPGWTALRTRNCLASSKVFCLEIHSLTDCVYSSESQACA